MRRLCSRMRSRSAEGTARGQRLFVVSVIAVLLGFLVVLQLRSQALVARSLANQDNTSIDLLINDLNHANGQLLQQSLALDQRQRALRQGLVTGGTDTQAIEKELTVLRAVAGPLPVHRPRREIPLGGPVKEFENQGSPNNPRNGRARRGPLQR